MSFASNSLPNSLNDLPSAPVHVPAGFWRRFAAAWIDTLIMLMAILPLNFGLQLFSATVPSSGEASVGMLLATGVYFVLTTLVTWLYPAWFYANKGATPGKSVMGLEVIDVSPRGPGVAPGRPSYGQTFMREMIGKTVSAAILAIGYLMVAFRADKRGLHDLMAQTQVVRRQQ
jgi:uncharacterized RDD family membrane protein YckC